MWRCCTAIRQGWRAIGLWDAATRISWRSRFRAAIPGRHSGPQFRAFGGKTVLMPVTGARLTSSSRFPRSSGRSPSGHPPKSARYARR